MERAKTLGLLLGLSVAACEVGYNRDGTFDRWCDGSLCDWQTDEGEIARVSTWHVRDYGVDLVANPTQISTDGRYGALYWTCARFSVVADIEPTAQVKLEIDYGNDGSVDNTQILSGKNYELTEFVISFPEARFGVRYTIRKTGPGRARIADFAVGHDYGCELDSESLTVPDGASCSEGGECTHGLCIGGVCSACGAAPCSDGATCSDDVHCASGTCSAGICSKCGAEGSCGAGDVCNKNTQCASGSCLGNFTPGSSDSNATLAQCAECTDDAGCPDGFCVSGACAVCRDDADCSDEKVCRYAGGLDTSDRACSAPLSEAQPRGALCEQDADCADGLSCDAAEGLAPRCGRACAAPSDCAEGFCISPKRGLVPCVLGGCNFDDVLVPVAEPNYVDTGDLGRVGTCYVGEQFIGLFPER